MFITLRTQILAQLFHKENSKFLLRHKSSKEFQKLLYYCVP